MLTVVTKFEAYLLTEKRVSTHTFSAYKRDLLQFLQLRTLTTDQAIMAVNQQEVQAYLVQLKQLRISARSVARKLCALRLFFTYVAERSGIANPIQDIILPKVENRLPTFISETDVAQLLRAADADSSRIGLRNRVMLYLMYGTGMRVSELIKLHIDDLIFESGVVLVRGKGGKQRHIPLPSSLSELIKEYLATAHPNVMQGKKGGTLSPYLFPITYAGKNKPISRQALWGILKDIWARTGIDRPLSPHALRHSLATHLLKGGADLRSLQLILGHENLATVQVYTHVETSHLREVYNKKHPRSE